jgi:hypothetical protein
MFEGETLLDWGTRGYTPGESAPDAAPKKLRFLLNLYTPSVVVAREPRTTSSGAWHGTKRVIEKLRQETESQGVQFCF